MEPGSFGCWGGNMLGSNSQLFGRGRKKGRHELPQPTSVNYFVHVSQSNISQICGMSNEPVIFR